MSSSLSLSFSEHFKPLVDPRIDRTKFHPLLNVVFIAVCALLCGANDIVGMEKFGKNKRAWLEKFLDLSNGVPSHDTFGRVIQALDPQQFLQCFAGWVQNLCGIDGGPTGQHRRQDDSRIVESGDRPEAIARGQRSGPPASSRCASLSTSSLSNARTGTPSASFASVSKIAQATGLIGTEAAELAIKTKIEMSSDADEVVRDWATFGLGAINVDTPEIRAALFARIADEDEITRGEALVGLARRKDQRAIEPLIKELEGYFAAEHGSYSVEAAEEFADARLLPVLMRLKELADSNDTRLDDAIRRCSSGVPDTDGGLHYD